MTHEHCHTASFPVSDMEVIRRESCRVSVSCEGKVLVDYSVYEKHPEPIPTPAEYMKAPEELRSTEELYLAATHLEQYRHATYEPADYYLEGLRRDSTDIRLNNGYGLLLFKRGCVKESIPYFEAAIRKQTWKTPNPYYGECYFNLGLALEADGQEDKAYDAFYKATWSAETQSTGFFWLANLSARKRDYEAALAFVTKSLLQNWHNMKARTLKAAIMRKLGIDTSELLKESLEIDPLYMGCLYEQVAASNMSGRRNVGENEESGDQTADAMNVWKEKMRTEAHNYLALSLDYIKAGFYEDALVILDVCPEESPMLRYYQGYVYEKLGDLEASKVYFLKGEETGPDYCFPNRVEEISILETAIRVLSKAPMAHYYLGNLFYDKKQYQTATRHWERAVEEKDTLAMAWRNLSIAYFNKEHDGEKALAAMEKACSLDKSYPRFLLEYDQLAARLSMSNEIRLRKLEECMEITKDRDDLHLRYITLLNCAGRYEDALDALESHKFHPWEGGEGRVSTQYRYALIELAKKKLAQKQADEALKLLEATITYPENLGEGKLPNVPDNQAHYYMGIAYGMLNDTKKAEEFFMLAASGPQEPEKVLYYNDQPSDFIFYQGLANRKLGREDAAKKAFHQLTIFGERHLFDEVSYDFFAVSLPEIEVYQDNPALRNIQYCNYLRALGAIGLGKKEEALGLFEEILRKQAEHQGALVHRELV